MAPTEVSTTTQSSSHAPFSQQQAQCAKYQYVVTAAGPKIVPVSAHAQQESKDEESAADYNSGGYLAVKLGDAFKNGRYVVQRKLGCVPPLVSPFSSSEVSDASIYNTAGDTSRRYGSSRTRSTPHFQLIAFPAHDADSLSSI